MPTPPNKKKSQIHKYSIYVTELKLRHGYGREIKIKIIYRFFLKKLKHWDVRESLQWRMSRRPSADDCTPSVSLSPVRVRPSPPQWRTSRTPFTEASPMSDGKGAIADALIVRICCLLYYLVCSIENKSFFFFWIVLLKIIHFLK